MNNAVCCDTGRVIYVRIVCTETLEPISYFQTETEILFTEVPVVESIVSLIVFCFDKAVFVICAEGKMFFQLEVDAVTQSEIEAAHGWRVRRGDLFRR